MSNYDAIKAMVLAFIFSILAYFEPIKSFLTVMVICYVANLFFGISESVIRQGKELDIKKFTRSVVEVLIYLAIVLLIFMITKEMEEYDYAKTIVKGFVMLVIYAYMVNILKNAKSLYPKSQPLAIAYEVLSIKFIEKFMPWARDFLKKDRDEKE